MLNPDDEITKKLLFTGKFGIEKESLRVTRDGHMAHTPHLFVDNPRISRDFCENQVEINTDVNTSVESVMSELRDYTDKVWHSITPSGELLWPFSNPAYINGVDDIPIASFTGANEPKTIYRRYLSKKYGRYKMAFSGIHFNYSFDERLLRRAFELDGSITDYSEYKNRFYLDLAVNASSYGWLLVCLTAASPVMDSSYRENQTAGRTIFTGMSSVRCSENGYWNFFTPILNFESAKKYAESIRRYVDMGMLYAPSELYYPVRLKPRGDNSIDGLMEHGIDHIELRMIDLNPFFYEGINKKDVYFIWYYLVYLAMMPARCFGEREQVQAVADFRNASRYNLETVHIEGAGGRVLTAPEAGLEILGDMKKVFEKLQASDSGFYMDKTDGAEEIPYGMDPLSLIDFEADKLKNPGNRYAFRVREQFGDDFTKKGIALSKHYGSMAADGECK